MIKTKFPALETKRLTLRAPAPKDAAAYAAVLSAPGVTRFSNWPDKITWAQVERSMRWMAKVHASGKGCAWIIEERKSNALVGAIRFLRDAAKTPLLRMTAISLFCWHCVIVANMDKFAGEKSFEALEAL
jgi:RimJ/RimL family protein N-acetyltransferase